MPLLFSYGTLRDGAVQQSIFGRLLESSSDELVGFEQTLFEVTDPAFVATSGKSHHAMLRRTDRPEHRVRGLALEVTDDELALADAYEPAGYARAATVLASGRDAWVYVGANAV
jgi:hypothetical protein